LQSAGPVTAEELVPAVYDDVAPQRHAMALRSLTAHLIKLQSDQRAILEDSRWRAA
jgi:hypothetical protein